MKLIKVDQVAKEPWEDKLFTGPVGSVPNIL
jgi:hypothetical protein